MSSHKRLLGVIAFLALLLLVFQVTGLRQNFSLGFVQSAVLAHPVTGMLTFVLLFSVGNLVHVPGLIFMAAAVLALGRVWGGVATYMAACISCGVTFCVVRWLGGDALAQLKNPLARRLLAGLHARPIASMLVLRLFFQTMPTLNATLAMSGMRFSQYMLGTLLGLPLPIALYCIFFEYLAALFGIGFH